MPSFASPWTLARSLPAPNRRALFGRLLALALSNGLVGFLVTVGRVQPLALVVFVGLEAALLSLIETAQLRGVPPQNRPAGDRRSLPERLGVPLLMAVIVAANLAVVASLLETWPVLLAMVRHPASVFVGTALVWPLAITLGKALLDVRSDARRFAEQGGEFVSTPGLNAQAHALTLVLGAIPHALPILAWAAVTARYFARRRERLGSQAAIAEPVSRAALAALGLYGLATALFLGWVVSSGAAGWSTAFFSAKVVSEALILCFPALRPTPSPRASVPEPAPAAVPAPATPGASRRARHRARAAGRRAPA